MSKKQPLLYWFLAIALVGCTLPGSKAASQEKELREALERYLAVENESRITYDTTELPSVATGAELENMLNFITMYKKLEAEGSVAAVRSAEEFKVEWVKVLASGSSWAVIEAKKNYLSFSQDVQTGKRSYDGGPTRWRIQRYLLIEENGVWKVDRILEGVSWSG